MYQIISDSACDLTELYIKKHNIEIVPLTASLDGETYLKDKTEINRKDFYTTMVGNLIFFQRLLFQVLKVMRQFLESMQNRTFLLYVLQSQFI